MHLTEVLCDSSVRVHLPGVFKEACVPGVRKIARSRTAPRHQLRQGLKLFRRELVGVPAKERVEVEQKDGVEALGMFLIRIQLHVEVREDDREFSSQF